MISPLGDPMAVVLCRHLIFVAGHTLSVFEFAQYYISRGLKFARFIRMGLSSRILSAGKRDKTE